MRCDAMRWSVTRPSSPVAFCACCRFCTLHVAYVERLHVVCCMPLRCCMLHIAQVLGGAAAGRGDHMPPSSGSTAARRGPVSLQQYAAQLPAVVGLLCIASLRMPRMLQRESAAASAAKCMGVIARIFADMSCPWRLNSGWRDRRISWLRRNGARVELSAAISVYPQSVCCAVL